MEMELGTTLIYPQFFLLCYDSWTTILENWLCAFILSNCASVLKNVLALLTGCGTGVVTENSEWIWLNLDFHIILYYIGDFITIAQWPGLKFLQFFLVSSSRHLLFLKHHLMLSSTNILLIYYLLWILIFYKVIRLNYICHVLLHFSW